MFQYITFRSACAIILSLIISMVFGKKVIRMLQKQQIGEEIRDLGLAGQMEKKGTPTMGGIIFILSAAAAMILCGWSGMMSGSYEHLFVLAFSLIFGGIGFIDDYVKVKKHRNLGLTALQKLALQLAAAALYLLLLRWSGSLSGTLYIPFWNITVSIPWWIYLVFAMFVIVGCVNAVNLTDGVDGLASGVTIPVMAFFAVTAAVWSSSSESRLTTLGLFPAALFGGLAGFLVYNFHPAKVFMGDTGSLFLGAAVCGTAFAMDMPLILISAYDWSEFEVEAREAGISGFISKPLFKSTLFYGLQKYMGVESTVDDKVDQNVDLTGKRVLVAEDNDLNWEVLNELLSDVGLELEWAENGQICLDKFRQASAGYYDAILMDIRMPVMNGYEATKAIRALPREDAAAIPIIAMTADAFSEDVQRCLQCGMNAHVAKPIHLEELSRLLERFLKK